MSIEKEISIYLTLTLFAYAIPCSNIVWRDGFCFYWNDYISSQRFALPALGQGRRSRPARKMIRRVKLLEIATESPASGARCVSQPIHYTEDPRALCNLSIIQGTTCHFPACSKQLKSMSNGYSDSPIPMLELWNTPMTTTWRSIDSLRLCCGGNAVLTCEAFVASPGITIHVWASPSNALLEHFSSVRNDHSNPVTWLARTRTTCSSYCVGFATSSQYARRGGLSSDEPVEVQALSQRYIIAIIKEIHFFNLIPPLELTYITKAG